MNIKEEIKNSIHDALIALNIYIDNFSVECSDDNTHGDYATNVALIYFGKLNVSARKDNQDIKHREGFPESRFPKELSGGITNKLGFFNNSQELAQKIVEKLNETKSPMIEKIEVAGAGFINFHLSSEFFIQSINDILKNPDSFGQKSSLIGKKMMFEYTDPNPFKVFHIGHLMSNAIGEALAKMAEWQGAKVIRANYQGDIGMHVAKAIFGMINLKDSLPNSMATLSQKTKWLGECYIYGAQAFTEGKENEINEINKKIYEKSDQEVNSLYEIGRKWSLDHFEEIYKKLGTKFDYYFFESEFAESGKAIVMDFLGKDIFEKSDGAIIFDGEKFGLHKRVFINSMGLPTYEAKDIGLNKRKFEVEPDIDTSYIITGNEQNDYFKVVLKAFEFIEKKVFERTKHISHGMMLGPEGKKMASRKGDVISGEGLLNEIQDDVKIKIEENKRDVKNLEEVSSRIAVSAIKFSILKQQIGKNIIFDKNQALSFEGDSGPYLLYTYVRAKSILEKSDKKPKEITQSFTLGKMLHKLPEIIEESWQNLSPQKLMAYILKIAQEFNSFYGNTKIIGSEKEEEYLSISLATSVVIKNGLTVLGISVVDEM